MNWFLIHPFASLYFSSVKKSTIVYAHQLHAPKPACSYERLQCLIYLIYVFFIINSVLMGSPSWILSICSPQCRQWLNCIKWLVTHSYLFLKLFSHQLINHYYIDYSLKYQTFTYFPFPLIFDFPFYITFSLSSILINTSSINPSQTRFDLRIQYSASTRPKFFNWPIVVSGYKSFKKFYAISLILESNLANLFAGSFSQSTFYIIQDILLRFKDSFN